MSVNKQYKGGCLCGEIQYLVDQIEPQMAYCHCRMCRKFHGAAFSTFGEAKVKNFHWLKGEQNLKTYRAPNGTERQFCRHCGSSLIFKPANDKGEVVEFSLGTLDTDINQRPDAHVFVESAACWYEINDKLPKFKAGREQQD